MRPTKLSQVFKNRHDIFARPVKDAAILRFPNRHKLFGFSYDFFVRVRIPGVVHNLRWFCRHGGFYDRTRCGRGFNHLLLLCGLRPSLSYRRDLIRAVNPPKRHIPVFE